MSFENIEKNGGGDGVEKIGAQKVGAEKIGADVMGAEKIGAEKIGGDGELARRRAVAMALVEGVAGRLGQLTGQQQQAIALMLSGCALAAVARSVKVSRGTVYKWLRDRTFTSAMNSWRYDMARAARSRLTALSGAAVKTIHAAIAGGDAQVAMGVLKGLGVLRPQGMEGDEEEEHVVIFRRSVDRSGGRRKD